MLSQLLELAAGVSEQNRKARVVVLIVEQKVRESSRSPIASASCANGRVSVTGPAAELHDDTKLREVYL